MISLDIFGSEYALIFCLFFFFAPPPPLTTPTPNGTAVNPADIKDASRSEICGVFVGLVGRLFRGAFRWGNGGGTSAVTVGC